MRHYGMHEETETAHDHFENPFIEAGRFHVTREYATDPLELLVVREVMRTRLVVLPAGATVDDLRDTLVREPAQRGQHLYPVVDHERRIRGVITRKELRELTKSAAPVTSLGDLLRDPVVAHPGEPLRAVVFRMAGTGLTRFPVVDDDGRLAGMISLHDLLMARVRNLKEERQRERVLRIRLPLRSLSDSLPPVGSTICVRAGEPGTVAGW